MLTYDSDADGYLDTNTETGGFAPGTRLRLGRVGDHCTVADD